MDTVNELNTTDEADRDPVSSAARPTIPEGLSHNLACLNTLWTLDLVDQRLYEIAKIQAGDHPDFEKEGEQPAVGGPAAALTRMIAGDLLKREQFEALAQRYIQEGVAREQNQKEDLHRICILESVDSEFCNNIFRQEMGAKKARIYGPYVAAIILAIVLFGILPLCVRFLSYFIRWFRY